MNNFNIGKLFKTITVICHLALLVLNVSLIHTDVLTILQEREGGGGRGGLKGSH